jgi:hypothetical protein
MNNAETRKEQAAVDRLIPILDKLAPDWRDRVDGARLDLGDGCNCILGQVFGGYWEGKERIYPLIGGAHEWRYQELYYGTLPGSVERLEDYWLRRIEETR